MTTPEDDLRARKRRSLVIALGLVAFVVLVYAITMIQLTGAETPNVRPL
jgi:hypothetical protein